MTYKTTQDMCHHEIYPGTISYGRDVSGQESHESPEKVSKKNSRSGKSGKVRENACKVGKIFYFDLNIFKSVLWS